MTSIRSLLDNFGPPPREICLDWAYQIHFNTARQADDTELCEATDTSCGPLDSEASWTSLEVRADGSLRLDRLTASMARQALNELQQWSGCAMPDRESVQDEARDSSNREIELSVETIGAGSTLDQGSSNCEPSQGHAIRKRNVQRRAIWLTKRRSHLTAAATVLAVAVTVACLWTSENGAPPAATSQSAKPERPVHRATPAKSQHATHDEAVDIDGDFLTTRDNAALDDDWTTSAAWTSDVLGAEASQPMDRNRSATPTPLDLSVPPSLLAQPRDAFLTLPAVPSTASPESHNQQQSSELHAEAGRSAHATSAEELPALPVEDVMSQVVSAVAKADRPQDTALSRDAPAEAVASAEPTEENIASEGGNTPHQPPLMLTRDKNVVRVQVPRHVRRLREPHWTAHVEPAEGFVCEPATAQIVDARTGAQWRVYSEDAQSPRACLIVSVRRSGRDLALEWSLRGSAEDLPLVHLPVARPWLDALSAQLKLTTVTLHDVANASSQQVPRELRAFAQNQRQRARQQLTVAERLLTLLADVEHLASLLDDELLCHAELRESASGPLLAAYGSCDLEAANADESLAPAKQE